MEVKDKVINNTVLQINAQQPTAYRQGDIRNSVRQVYHDPAGQMRRENPAGIENAATNAIKENTAINAIKDSLKNALISIEKHMNRGISLEVEDELGVIIVKIIDRESGELVRQVPFEDALEISKHLKAQLEDAVKKQGGLFIDKEI
jgi:flagellar protein FlaG